MRPGDVYPTKFGRLRILKYKNTFDVTVKFDTGYTTTVSAGQIRQGCVKDPLAKSIHGLGYIGQGQFKCTEDGKNTKEYSLWVSMFKRCYSKEFLSKFPTYLGCSVHPKWHNFQTFASWANKATGFGLTNYDLDKDLLVKGNKIYGPKTCVFIPYRLNALLLKSDKTRGTCVIGVTKITSNSHKSRFKSQCKDYLGKNIQKTFDTEDLAFTHYKRTKEQAITNCAERYKSRISNRAYRALLNYKVDIND